MAEVEVPNPEELREIREKGFARKTALITAVFAMVLAIASLGGNHAMKEMLLSQEQASDQWAYYQAKSIREHLYKSQKMLLENELLLSDTLNPDATKSVKASIDNLAAEESRFTDEKKEIQQEATKLEKERDINRARDLYFEYAEVLLQIAIVMASVSIIAASLPVFFFDRDGRGRHDHVRKRISSDIHASVFALSAQGLLPSSYLFGVNKLGFFQDYAAVRWNGFGQPDVTTDYGSRPDDRISAQDSRA